MAIPANYSQADRYIPSRTTVKHLTRNSALTSYTMLPTDRTVYVTHSGSFSLKLPKVAQCMGQIYVIKDVARTSGNLVITDDNDDVDFSTITLNATNEYAVVLSDGLSWHTLFKSA